MSGNTPCATAREDEPMGFEQDIKPLFREDDRNAMRFAFDLWSPDESRPNPTPSSRGSRPARCRATELGPPSVSPSSAAGSTPANPPSSSRWLSLGRPDGMGGHADGRTVITMGTPNL
jgi:hypothetical protein